MPKEICGRRTGQELFPRIFLQIQIGGNILPETAPPVFSPTNPETSAIFKINGNNFSQYSKIVSLYGEKGKKKFVNKAVSKKEAAILSNGFDSDFPYLRFYLIRSYDIRPLQTHRFH